MSTLPTASIIIVGYNSYHFLDRCLKSLLVQRYPQQYEIVFVDNGSSDGSSDYVKTWYPTIRVIECVENLGYAGGNNLGARHAHGDILVFVNPDTQATPDWLTELVRPLTMNESIGLTTSKVTFLDCPDLINTCGNNLSLAGITTCRYEGQSSCEVQADEEVAAVSGAAFAIRADLFWALQGFDERFWMYLEDTDLSWRARLTGYRCILAAKSVIAHDHAFSLSSDKTSRIERNRYLMLAKNLSGPALLALLPQLALVELLTWGWAVLQGPAYLRAKAAALLWIIQHITEVRHTRQTTQRQRQVPDRSIIRLHEKTPVIQNLANGLVQRLFVIVVAPVANTFALFAMLLLSIGERDRRSAQSSGYEHGYRT